MFFKGSLAFLALLLIMPLAFLLASPVPVHAAGVTIVPNSGIVGTSVQVSGNGFAGRVATIHWDGQVILSKVPISEKGELTCDIEIPSGCKGNHIIKITDDSNWTDSTASAIFTVLPSIKIFPKNARPYNSIMVSGSGFAPLEKDIKVTWDGVALPGSAQANERGTWSINVEAPLTKGEYYIGAFSNSTGASEIGELKFIVCPFAKAQPLSGPVGTEITVEAYCFRTSEDGITITWDNKIILTNMLAGTDGNISTTLKIPPSTRGRHILGVFGNDFMPRGQIPDNEFDVISNVELQPASGNKGTKVTVKGTGFTEGETITLSFEGKSLEVSASADNTGSFSVAFQSPQSSIQDSKVQAVGNKGSSAEAIFTVEKITPPTPRLLSPGQGARVPMYDSVGDVFLGAARRLIGIITFSGSGQEGFGVSEVTFDWSTVKNKTKITYDLEIARDGGFSSQVLLKKGLVDSEYTLSKSDKLGRDGYSWRVKAVDDIGNESPWSEAQKFEMIPMTARVLILSIFLPLLFIAVVAAAVFVWRMRKARGY